ncbi:MAG: hypothetical protein FD163_190 [Hyphomonadaceae bacterium]|nr:MAG: hypothetical protein FD128_869 [Hyphomonadaceae bacterium]KAF0186915.1 MAG: hypothetical protein FD163_190 [Hyphomonadaceae bacterium]
MSLNIKNQEVCDLASSVAALTKTNKTEAIKIALQERLRVIGGESRLEKIHDILIGCKMSSTDIAASKKFESEMFDYLEHE